MPEQTTVYRTETTDRKEHIRMVKSLDAFLALLELQTYLRNQLKYQCAGKETEELQQQFHDTLSNFGIDLDDCLE